MPDENPRAGRDLARLKPTLAQLGAVLGMSGRWVGMLRSRGVLPPDGATLAENVAAWVAYRGDRNG